MQVSTTLKDSEGERFTRSPYLFGSEMELSAWKDEFDKLMAEFACEIRSPCIAMEPLLVSYDEDVPMIHEHPPEVPARLASAIRRMWRAGDLDLRMTLSAA